ncbi:restriction endonuclease subunit S [Enterococcus cecorum]|uniref:restriction endonuclease subunit S n=1 Tax=Enterococcus cecorum TaxID=44008 RepID=UPI00200A7B96|nr:restriction endonuclease subunit S [Enterococcus cecorum]
MGLNTVTAMEYCNFVTDGTHASPKATDNGYKLITSKHLKRYDIDFNSAKYISEEDYRKVIERSSIEQWDILFSMIGTIGNTYIETNDNINYACKNMGIFKLGGDEMKSKWLYYYLQSPKAIEYIVASSRGTTQGYVPLGALRKMPVDVVEDKKRNEIVSFLWNLDEKIKNNIAINNNLEQQAKALYKDWFFDFSPFSSNGNLPDGWRFGLVGDIIQLHDSKRVPLSGAERDKMAKVYPYYGATSLMDYVDNYLFDGIYLLLGEDGSVIDKKGFPILQYVEGKFWVNNHAHIITGKNGFSVEQLYLLFSLTNVQSIVTGAVQPKISQTNLKKLPVIIPSEKDLKKFDVIVQPIFAQIRNLRAENNKLSVIRDSLLPKLMSDEIDVSNINL